MKEFVNCKGQQGFVRVAQLIAGVQWLVLGCSLAIGGTTLPLPLLSCNTRSLQLERSLTSYFRCRLYVVRQATNFRRSDTRGHSVDERAADER